MRRFLAVVVFSLLAIALFASGVFAADQKSGRDGDITVVQALDMISFDPTATSDLNNQYVLYNIYSRLFTFPKNRLAGDVKELCKDFKRVSNTEWHFTIWENVKYHDGTTLTVDDVVYSLNRAKASAALGALFKPVKEIKKVDNKTLSITTDGPYPAMTSALTHAATSIVPKSYAEKAEKTKDWSKPVGSGRYKFVSRMIGDSVKFERFDGYFNKDEVAQNKTLTIKVIPEGTNRTIAIETGAADLNAEFVDGRIYKHAEVHVGFACDTPRGLMVPVVRDAHTLTAGELSTRMKELTAQAVAGTIAVDDLTGGTFTVSNLGGLGIESFTPLLNPPQVAILGVDAIGLKAVRREGRIEFIDSIGLSITLDHQVIDGAPGARFLKVVKEKIENVESLCTI